MAEVNDVLSKVATPRPRLAGFASLTVVVHDAMLKSVIMSLAQLDGVSNMAEGNSVRIRIVIMRRKKEAAVSDMAVDVAVPFPTVGNRHSIKIDVPLIRNHVRFELFAPCEEASS